MGIGQRQPIILRKVTVAIDPTTGRNVEAQDEDPTGIYKTWAEVTGSGGGRDYLNGQIGLTHTRDFLVRFRFDKFPNCEWKITYQGTPWTVSNIRRVDEKKFYWTFSATRKNDA